MYEKAVEKITTEMNANEHHPYVQVIGQFLLRHLEQHPEHEEHPRGRENHPQKP